MCLMVTRMWTDLVIRRHELRARQAMFCSLHRALLLFDNNKRVCVCDVLCLSADKLVLLPFKINIIGPIILYVRSRAVKLKPRLFAFDSFNPKRERKMAQKEESWGGTSEPSTTQDRSGPPTVMISRTAVEPQTTFTSP